MASTPFQTFANTWDDPGVPIIGSTYAGMEHGDSGGALLAETGELCGINSKFYWSADPYDYTPGNPLSATIYAGSVHAALDAPGTFAWLAKSPIIDIYGNWMGTCQSGPVALRNVDTDCDLIPDACDPCPYVPDQLYRKTGKFSPPSADANGQLIDADKDGVPDACDSCSGKNGYAPYEKNPWVVVAGSPTAMPVSANGVAFAPSCANPAVGVHLEQPDADNDGLGDVCDTCGPPTLKEVVCCNTDADCAPLHAGSCEPFNVSALPGTATLLTYRTGGMALQCLSSAGRCARKADRDDDGRPDGCDNCPTKYQYSNEFGDQDGDGIGDACDNCSGLSTVDLPLEANAQAANREGGVCVPGAAGDGSCLTANGTVGANSPSVCLTLKDGTGMCSSCDPTQPAADAFCVVRSGNSKSVCVVVGKGGVCSLQRDTDGDGVGDRCDGCPTVASSNDANCNEDIEIEEGLKYPFKTDRCDPVPCAYGQNALFPANAYSAPGTPAPGFDAWAMVSLDAKLLPRSVPGAFQYPASGVAPHEDVGFRHCLCNLADPQKCKSNCPLSAAEFGSPVSTWKVPAMTPASTTSSAAPKGVFGPNDPLFLADATLAAVLPQNANPAFPEPKLSGPTRSLLWDVSLNGADVVHVSSTPSELCSDGFGLDAVLWSAVRDVSKLTVSSPAYLKLSNHYERSFFGLPQKCAAFIPPLLIGCSGTLCSTTCPHCGDLAFVCPQCGETCPQCGKGIPSLVWSVDPSGLYSVDAKGSRRYASLPADISTLLNNPATAVASAADALEAGDGGLVDVVLVNKMVPANGVVAATVRGGAFVPLGGRVGDPNPRRSAEIADGMPLAQPAEPPSFGDETALVVSGFEGVLFAIGTEANALWAYGLTSRIWSHVQLHGSVLGRPLAATYRVSDRSIYVLDEKGHGLLRKVSLLRVDLESRKVSSLGTWPSFRNNLRHFLSVSTKGELVLAASTSTGVAAAGHLVLVVDPHPNGGLSVRRALVGNGSLALSPSLDLNGLTLPILGDGLEPRFLANEDLDKSHHPGLGIGSCF